ncbi:MAG: Mur ligase domain-containing protein, partial [Actinomycetes bacterium]|nr:Mur ligase domain-containing protein [Actinomycetes bacterium]
MSEATAGTYAHFIGVGGAGMSGLALVLLQRGVAVSGSDIRESRYTRELERAGMTVHIGHDVANLPDPDPQVVVLSTAIPDTNPELIEARRRGIELWPRARMLAELTRDATVVAVAGTHGKTSTSSMIVSMLADVGLRPGFCIGGQVDAFGTNADAGLGAEGGESEAAGEGTGEVTGEVRGKAGCFVVEADESDGSFVHLSPDIAVITNLESDHVDHYGSMDELRGAFAAFMQRLSDDGVLLVGGDDEALVSLARDSGRRVVTYGRGEDCDLRYGDVQRAGVGSRFSVTVGGSLCAAGEGDHQIQTGVTLPGEHMVANATAALGVAVLMGLDSQAAGGAL